jgi:hypothetical protein
MVRANHNLTYVESKTNRGKDCTNSLFTLALQYRSLQIVLDNLQTIKSIFSIFGFYLVRTNVKTAIGLF